MVKFQAGSSGGRHSDARFNLFAKKKKMALSKVSNVAAPARERERETRSHTDARVQEQYYGYKHK